MFYSELVSDDYMDTSYDSVFNFELDDDMVVDSPPASDWSINEAISDLSMFETPPRPTVHHVARTSDPHMS